MSRLALIRLLTVVVLVFTIAASAGAAGKNIPPLAKLPTGDAWYLILVTDEPSGFLHQNVTETSEGYRITADSSVKFTVMGYTRDAMIREVFDVNRDLTLRSAHIEQTIDKSPKTVDGTRTSDGWKITITDAAGKKEKHLKARGPVFPMAALNVYPLLKGFVAGKKYQLQVFDGEETKLKKVEVEALGVEQEKGDTVLHLTNDTLPALVSYDIWLRPDGTMLRENIKDGLVVTRLEAPETVHAFMSASAVARRDLILDYSLIRVSPPLVKPAEKQRIVVELADYPAKAPLPEGPGEQAVRAGNTVTVTVDRKNGKVPATPTDAADNLSPGTRIPSDHPDIAALAKKIIGDEKIPGRKLELLVSWVAKNISGSVTDSQTPLETLINGNGNCQAHARLLAALARAAGIPTRFVSGLVYADGLGFLYHSWNEAIVDGQWVSVDATFGQVPSDATHIRIAIGDAPGDMAPLAALIGRIKAKIISAAP